MCVASLCSTWGWSDHSMWVSSGNDVLNTMQKAAFSVKYAQSKALHLQLDACISRKVRLSTPSIQFQPKGTAGSRKKSIRDWPCVTVELLGTFSTETYTRETISNTNLILKPWKSSWIISKSQWKETNQFKHQERWDNLKDLDHP